MSQVFLFRSTDANAPAGGATNGLLNAVLKACLVDGYGSVAVSSVTRSGSVVTVTTGSAHGFDVRSTIQIAGAAQADYNGKWKVASVPTSTTLTFAISTTPASPATGSITLKRAPAGWSAPYTGTNKLVLQPAIGGNQFLLRLDDGAPSPGDARVAAVRGYESMSDVDTGTSPFPTVAQVSAGLSFVKAHIAAGVRPWFVIASEHAFYWSVDFFGNGAGFAISGFGDLTNVDRAGDGYATFVVGGNVTTTMTGASGAPLTRMRQLNGTNASGTQGGHYLARSYDQSTKSAAFGKMSDLGQSAAGASGMTYPAANNSGLYLTPLRVFQGGFPRGTMPGLYVPLHDRPLANGAFTTGVIQLPGRDLLALYTDEGDGFAGEVLLDVTGPW